MIALGGVILHPDDHISATASSACAKVTIVSRNGAGSFTLDSLDPDALRRFGMQCVIAADALATAQADLRAQGEPIVAELIAAAEGRR